MFSFLEPYKLAIYGILTITTLFLAALGGYKYRDYIAVQAQVKEKQEVIEKKIESDVVNNKVVVKYVDKIVNVEKQVPVYIERTNNEITPKEVAACVIPDSFIRLYNDSLSDATSPVGVDGITTNSN